MISLIGARLTVLFFWSGGDGYNQLYTSIAFTVSFICGGIFMCQSNRQLLIPGGILTSSGCLCLYYVSMSLPRIMIHDPIVSQNINPSISFQILAITLVASSSFLSLQLIPFAPLSMIIIMSGAVLIFILAPVTFCRNDMNIYALSCFYIPYQYGMFQERMVTVQLN